MVDFKALAAQRKAQKARPKIHLDALQQSAVDAALAGENIFLTGAGGVGKSETLRALVRALRKTGKEVAVTASTGVAAINVRGTTIHSLLKTGLHGSVDALSSTVNPSRIADTQEKLAHVDVIVIDEISMLTGDYISMMQWWLSLVMNIPLAKYSPFGGIQVIFVGDFLQLPPVIKGKVDHEYAFESPAWTDANLRHIHLQKVYRQTDEEMLKHLHLVRMGHAGAETLAYFNQRVGADLVDLPEPIRLFATNAAADKLNLERLDECQGPDRMYEARTDGHQSWQEAIRKNAPCEETLVLRKGARVIFIRNNWILKFHNGLRGTVIDMTADAIHVQGDNGKRYAVPVETWELYDSDHRVLATMTQFPLRLAWALTIHKSQGMSLDSLEADLSKVFEKGQTYVALSRVKSIEGLRLRAPLSRLHVRAARKVVKFYEEFSQ